MSKNMRISLLASFVILVNALREHPGATGMAFGGILLGVPVYYVWLRRSGSRFLQQP